MKTQMKMQIPMKCLTIAAANLFVVALTIVPAAHALDVTPAKITECRANLEKRLCYSPVTPHWYEVSDGTSASLRLGLKRYQDRKCSPTPTQRKAAILSVYDKLPKEAQAAFCAMKRIYLSYGDADFGARAEYFLDETQTKFGETEWGTPTISSVATGFVMEISEKNRFLGEDASAYATRVSQKRFGHDVAKGVAADLPVVEHVTKYGKDGALATTILHEIGHMVHRAANATRATIYKPMKATAWTVPTWLMSDESFSMKDSTLDPIWERMRSRQLQRVEVANAISFMKTTGIPTFYSSSGPDEDFAEWFMLHFENDVKMKVNGRLVFDLREEIAKNPVYQKKKAMMKALVDSPELFSLGKSSKIEGRL